MRGANAERNAEIIRLRMEGVGPRQIARRLGISNNIVAGVLNRASLTFDAGSPEDRAFRALAAEEARERMSQRARETWSDPRTRFNRLRGMQLRKLVRA